MPRVQQSEFRTSFPALDEVAHSGELARGDCKVTPLPPSPERARTDIFFYHRNEAIERGGGRLHWASWVRSG